MNKPKFSNRFNWPAGDNALGRVLAEKRNRADLIYDLTQSNPTQVGLAFPDAAILSAVSSPSAMVYKPDPRGLAGARSAIADYYGQMDRNINIDDLFLTAHTSEAYSMLFKLLTDPGDEILIPCPGYPLLTYLANFENLRTSAYPLRYDDRSGWYIDPEVVDALVTPRTRIIVAVNPNNPTGSFLSRQELAAIDEICIKRGLALIVDEVFSDFSVNTGIDRVLTAVNQSRCLTFALNGFSKMLALPQVKLGWIIITGDEDQVRGAGQKLEILMDFYLSVGAPVQHAVGELFSMRFKIQEQILQRLAENWTFLSTQKIPSHNFRVLQRQGGWYAVLEFNDALSDEERVLQLLETKDTLVHPGYFYDFSGEGFAVISLLPRPNEFQTGIRRLLE